MTLISKEALAASEGTKNLLNGILGFAGKVLDKIPPPGQPTDPTNPTEPINPTNPTEPINPTNPTDQEVIYMMQQLQQFWGQFEWQLGQLPPQQQQVVISYARQMIAQQLAPYPPEQQQEAVNLLQQTMSPYLAQTLLF